MGMREDVEGWKALADAATPGPWRRGIGNDYRATFGPRDEVIARDAMPSAGSLLAASREAIPAMADMLDRAAELLESWSQEPTVDEGTMLWLREWRGERPTGQGGVR